MAKYGTFKYGTTLYGQKPKTNWTETDYLNFGDLNRIEANCVALAMLLQTCGFVLSLTTITNRLDSSYMDFYDSLNRIESNILALFNCYGVAPPGWATPKTTWNYDQPISYLDTNRMEVNEQSLYNMLNSIIQELPVCGQGLEICGLGWYN